MTPLYTVFFFSLLVLVPAAWLLPERAQVTALAALTALFLLGMAPLSAGLLLGTAALSYGAFRLRWLRPGGATLLAVGQAVAAWAVFKSEFPQKMGWPLAAGVPLGLSYYAFRQIHYALERYKRTLPPHTFADYLRYLFFLPTLLVGPINRFPDFRRDERRRRWDAALFSTGLQRSLYGFVKIILLGNVLLTEKAGGLLLDLQPHHPALAIYLGAGRFVANAYVQFAGYSDVAIGLALLVGFRIPENFNAPFLAPNPAEFWRRYHITLSAWCRDYVFVPTLSLTRQPALAIAASMLVLGGWHEASARYLLWGAVQGGGILAGHQTHRWLRASGVQARFPRLVYWGGVVLTAHFFAFSGLLVQYDTLAEAGRALRTLFSL
jgi:alginate O-acetyltransferase complex protein AlgI